MLFCYVSCLDFSHFFNCLFILDVSKCTNDSFNTLKKKYTSNFLISVNQQISIKHQNRWDLDV